MKKAISLMMSLVMLVSILTGIELTASAAIKTGSCGVGVTYNLNTSTGILTISGSGDMTDYDSLEESFAPWYDDSSVIKTIRINSGVTSIGEDAFIGCEAVEAVTIGAGVQSIGIFAFSDCVSLKSITIPSGVTTIGNWAFMNCYSMTAIKVNTANANYCSVDGVLFNKAKTELIQYPLGKTATQYTVPDTVETIFDSAFASCEKLTKITIPDSVKKIESDAFSECVNLANIEIGSGITTIAATNSFYTKNPFYKTAFYNNTNNWENGALYLGEYLLEVSTSVSSTYEVKEGTRLIADLAFYNCALMSGVKIPLSTRIIGERAFSDCTNLKNLYYDSCEPMWNSNLTIGESNTALLTATKNYTHQWSAGVIISQPTCGSVGITRYTCTLCGSIKDDQIPKTDNHNFGNNSPNCVICGVTNPNYVAPSTNNNQSQNPNNSSTQVAATHEHTYTQTIEVYPACIYTGTVRYTCSTCGYSYTNEIPATGQHSFAQRIRENATCSKNGILDNVCELCDYVTSEIIPATGVHEYASDGKCKYCNAYNTVAIIKLDGITYKRNSSGEYIASSAKKSAVKKLTRGKKSFKVSLKKASGVKGYQIQYSTSKKFTKKTTKTATISKNSAKTPTKTIKKLKSKKTYYVRVRTYKTTKLNGKSIKVYSGWSSVKSVKVK